jgi:hypothetical protein
MLGLVAAPAAVVLVTLAVALAAQERLDRVIAAVLVMTQIKLCLLVAAVVALVLGVIVGQPIRVEMAVMVLLHR